MVTPSLIWFRRDLRSCDHRALALACAQGPVVPIFVLDNNLLFHPETAVARVEFLLLSLRALDRRLRQLGGRLLVRRGKPAQVLTEIAGASGARRVLAHTDTERLVGRVRDAAVSQCLAEQGIDLQWVEPAGVSAELISYGAWSQGWHRAMAEAIDPEPQRLHVPEARGLLADLPIPTLRDLGLIADGKPMPPAGSEAALERLNQFCAGPDSRTYHWELSYPSAKVTTGLSPYLKFGVITPRQCLQRIAASASDPQRRRSMQQLASRLRWGCSIHQRFRYLPQLELRSLWSGHDPAEADLSAQQQELYQAWMEGRTGFPIVDAAARCLQAEGGWLELNFRSRAIYASFLSNLCGIDWRFGALHFMRHLIDGDCPIDHYQWAMQAGATYRAAKAWSRIYHPGQVAVNRCDPHGLFIRRWLPELSSLTNDQLGAPPALAHYPAAVLDYTQARKQRLETLAAKRQAMGDIRSAMAQLPERFTPFASHRFPNADVSWCAEAGQRLHPMAVDLSSLDSLGWSALLSWFSMRRSEDGSADSESAPEAASEVAPESTAIRSTSKRKRQSPKGKSSPDQLSLNLE
ncbi:MAG: FAD-binding domain-containing protein [Vulcanococcus sp.]